MRRALISCYDKTGLQVFARGLAEVGFELVHPHDDLTEPTQLRLVGIEEPSEDAHGEWAVLAS